MASAARFQPLTIVVGLVLAAVVAVQVPARANTPSATQYTLSHNNLLLPAVPNADLVVPDTQPTLSLTDAAADFAAVPILSVSWRSSGWTALPYNNRARGTRRGNAGNPYRAAGFVSPTEGGASRTQFAPSGSTAGRPYRQAGFPEPWQAGIYYNSP